MCLLQTDISNKKSVMSNYSRLVFGQYGFFQTYKTLEDGYIVILALMDQCRLVTEELVKFIQKDKAVYRNKVKQICQRLYNPKGNTIEINLPGTVFKGWTKRVETKILNNMDEDSKIAFSIINGEVDELIGLDLVKFYNAISLELAKYNFQNKEIVDKTFRALFFADMCRFIIEMCLKKNTGNTIYLVKQFDDNLDKSKAFKITSEEVTRIYEGLIDLTSILLPKIDFEIPDDSPVAVSIDVISRKLISPHNIYKCAEAAGLDLRKTSNPDNFPEAIDARREAKRVNVPTQEDKDKEIINSKLGSLEEKTGWKVRISN